MKRYLLLSLFGICLLFDDFAQAKIEALPDASSQPASPPLTDENSFMGIRVGAEVRAKCTDPAVDVNHAKLQAVTPDTVIVVTATLDKFVLPKANTTLGSPVIWEVTRTVTATDSHSLFFWVIIVLAFTGIVAGSVCFWRWRQKVQDELLDFPEMEADTKPESNVTADL